MELIYFIIVFVIFAIISVIRLTLNYRIFKRVRDHHKKLWFEVNPSEIPLNMLFILKFARFELNHKLLSGDIKDTNLKRMMDNYKKLYIAHMIILIALLYVFFKAVDII
ncbi:MAG: hypothetical protein KKE20_05710 [Nanoarchaeota archaeon]|nr:hypothetical protein [Nanoarchaeota archaeon]